MLRESLKQNKGFGMVYVFMCVHACVGVHIIYIYVFTYINFIYLSRKEDKNTNIPN